jgi:uncharacterized protein (TIGR00106 family)
MLAEFTISPMSKGESMAESIAAILRIVDESGLPYQFHSMGTVVEGEWDDVMALIRRCHEAALGMSFRVATQIKIDDYPGRTSRLTGKVADVERVVGKKLGC